jgi:hypothetical protein
MGRKVEGVPVQYHGIELGTVLSVLAKGDPTPLEHIHGGRRGGELLLRGSSELVNMHKLVMSLRSKKLLMGLQHSMSVAIGRFKDLDSVTHSSRDFIHAVRLALTIAQFVEYNDFTIPLPQLLKDQRPYLQATTVVGIERVVQEKREGREVVPAEIMMDADEWLDDVGALATTRLEKSDWPILPPTNAVDHVNEQLIDYRLRWARA